MLPRWPMASAVVVAAIGVVRVLVPLGGGKDSITVLEVMSARAPAVRHRPVLPLPIRRVSLRAAGATAPSATSPRSAPCACATFGGPTPTTAGGAPTAPARVRWARVGRLDAPLGMPRRVGASLAALARGCDHVAVGNERSANYGNGVSWGGVEINHQYDKSYTFERKLRSHPTRDECARRWRRRRRRQRQRRRLRRWRRLPVGWRLLL